MQPDYLFTLSVLAVILLAVIVYQLMVMTHIWRCVADADRDAGTAIDRCTAVLIRLAATLDPQPEPAPASAPPPARKSPGRPRKPKQTELPLAQQAAAPPPELAQ